MSDDVVYVGRAGRGQDGPFGNPVRIGWKCPLCGHVHNDAGSTLPCFKRYLWNRINSDAPFRARLRALDGKTLFCPGCPKGSPTCHARVLEAAIAWLNTSGIEPKKD